MNTPAYYEINVAIKDAKPGWDGKPSYSHFFATHERSLRTKNDAQRAYEMFIEKFPTPEFQVSISARIEYGTKVDWTA